MTDSPSPLRAFLLLVPSIVAGSLLMGCGGSTAPAREPTIRDEAPQEEAATVHASAEIGGMNEEKSDEAFEKASSSLERCFREGQKRFELLSGEVTFLVRVDESGRGEAFVERSTLGDLATERCMTRALSAEKWPAPVGGRIGEARRPFVFDPPSDVRPAVDWATEDVDKALKKVQGAISDCKGSSAGPYEATIYVDQDGTVMSAGVSATPSDAASVADCLSNALKSATFPSPGSWPAKATFTL